MPAQVTIEIDDAQVKRFFRADGFTKKFNKRFSQTMRGFAEFAKGQVRKQIRSGKYPALGITQYIARAGQKEPTKVLRDTGAFEKSLKDHYVRESEHLTGMDFAFEGTSQNGLPYNKLAWILEEGRQWTPTDKERYAVAMMAKRRGAPDPEGAPKAKWEIPARSFLTDTFTKQEVLQKFFDMTALAIQRAAADLKAGT